MQLIIFGPPGVGKGTLSDLLAEKYKIPHISTGDIFRAEIAAQSELGRKVEHFIKGGAYVPDEIVMNVVRKRLQESDARKGFIFDGFPRTIFQADELGKVAKLDVVINLVVPGKIIITRLTARRTCRNCGAIYNTISLKPRKEGICDKCGGALFVRDDEKPEVVKERLKVYERQTAPLISYYRDKGLLKEVECNKMDTPPEEIVAKIMDVLKKVKK